MKILFIKCILELFYLLITYIETYVDTGDKINSDSYFKESLGIKILPLM